MMKKSTKAWLITAASLILIGCILFAGVMSTLGWDFAKLSTVRFETNTHDVTEPFGNISLVTDTADIVFALSNDGKCSVECYEEENAKHSVTVENGTLTVKVNEQKSLYDYIGFYFGSPKITVYLPNTEYSTLSVKDGTGNVEIPKGFTFESADISLSTGDVDFQPPRVRRSKLKQARGISVPRIHPQATLTLRLLRAKLRFRALPAQAILPLAYQPGRQIYPMFPAKTLYRTELREEYS